MVQTIHLTKFHEFGCPNHVQKIWKPTRHMVSNYRLLRLGFHNIMLWGSAHRKLLGSRAVLAKNSPGARGSRVALSMTSFPCKQIKCVPTHSSIIYVLIPSNSTNVPKRKGQKEKSRSPWPSSSTWFCVSEASNTTQPPHHHMFGYNGSPHPGGWPGDQKKRMKNPRFRWAAMDESMWESLRTNKEMISWWYRLLKNMYVIGRKIDKTRYWLDAID